MKEFDEKLYERLKKLAGKALGIFDDEQCLKKGAKDIRECRCLFASQLLSSKLFFALIKASKLEAIPPKGRLLFHVYSLFAYMHLIRYSPSCFSSSTYFWSLSRFLWTGCVPLCHLSQSNRIESLETSLIFELTNLLFTKLRSTAIQ